MKFDSYDMQKVYSDFLEMQLNQMDILQEMRNAMAAFTELESFKGLAAENTKAYLSDVHVSVVDSIAMAVMELEIKLLTLKQDFNATVDSDGDAVVEDTIIDGISEEVGEYITEAASHETAITDLVKSVSDIAALKTPDFSGYTQSLADTKKNGEDTLEKMAEFENRHLADMDNINEIFTAVNSAISYMSHTVNTDSYVPGSANETDWSQKLFAGQISAYFYASNADPNFNDTVYLDWAVQTGLTMLETLIPPDADLELVMRILKDGNLVQGEISGKEAMDFYGIGESIDDLRKGTRTAFEVMQLFKSGIRFVPKIDPATGETILKAVTATGKAISRSKQVAALKSLGIADDLARPVSRGLAQSLFSSKGLVITGKDAFKLKNGALDLKSIQALTQVAKAGKDSTSFMKEFAKGLKSTSKISKGLFIATIAIDFADGFYDERTRKFGEFDGAEFASKAIVDTGAFLAPIAAYAAAGSLVPGIGTAVGAVTGLVVAGLSLIKWGEPPKSVLDHASDWVEGAINDVGNFFAKLFW